MHEGVNGKLEIYRWLLFEGPIDKKMNNNFDNNLNLLCFRVVELFYKPIRADIYILQPQSFN